ncbi:MAG: sodium-translocating pyrophosphatase [Chloroflexi bacterium]|nr:sodium-translocating pyrophosphatase [Chloroflexota bacterium]
MSNTTVWLIFSLICGILSLGIGVYLFVWVKNQDDGNDRTREVAGWIHSGARAYLKKLYAALIIVSVIMAAVLSAVYTFDGSGRGLATALCYLIGAVCSAIAGYLGMEVAVRANVRSAVAANHSMPSAFNIAFRGGAVMGFAVVGVATIGMSAIYMVTKDSQMVLAFSLGASSLALLAKAGGGIYTKTADIAADLVGKVEVGIPEDDPRNPAVVADNVGDNVGDVAGMGADIFDSYVASAVAAMLLGATMQEIHYTILPLLLCALGILASIIGVYLVQVKEDGKPGKALNMGTIITCAAFAVLMIIAILIIPEIANRYIWAILIGTSIGIVIGQTTEFFTSDEFKPVQLTAEYSASGAAITIISGISYGLISIVPSILGIVISMLVSFYVCGGATDFTLGIYGVGISAVGMLAISGMIVSADAYGPIVDNARGIAEMSGMDQEVIDRADVLDSAGNTAKAITKGFSIAAAALTVLALFAAFVSEINLALVPYGKTFTIEDISLVNPLILAGLFLGAMCPPLFSALTMLSVTQNAFKMIEEIRAQFREHPEILEGTMTPDYNRPISLAAEGALKSLILPAVIAIVFPLAVGFIMGPKGLTAFLGGAIITGVIFALFMSNSGGLWDNAKKYVEAGNFGGKGSEAHKAAVIGDTVGDPFKDTAGPSLNTLITVMSLVASTFAPVIAVYHLFQ